FDWRNAKNIDGFPVKCKGHGKQHTYTAPLVCLDIDIMTGLDLVTQLPELSGHLKQKGLVIKDLVDNEKFATAIRNEESDIVQRMERARDQLQRTVPLIGKIVKHKLEDKQPAHGKPKFFIPLGGPGAGKGRTKQIAQEAADTKIVINSLDGNRYYSHIMKLIVTCGHHSDDYAMVRSFATAIRDRVEEESLKRRLNMYYDASGVNYEGRYDALLAKFKKAGFETHVYAAFAPLAYPTPQPGKLGVWERVVARAEDKSRAVPWPIVLEKHIQEAASLFAAARDCNVDYLTIYDTSPEKEKTGKIDGEKTSAAIKPDMLGALEITNHVSDQGETGKNAFVVGRDNGSYRVLRINDPLVFGDVMAKCLLNPHASGPKDLYQSRFPQASLGGVLQTWASSHEAAKTAERTL
ncbi:MAG: zeta toxin family protein, partial [Rickettsiales bacterium]